ncbi:esterase-like activity of phytase family protein [Actinomadura sediminis]|uniref:Esterase-like activity of phytase family protein n=1 Tax=Actinomadura sediminis TaxID=1038904 RepID=A0ABW3ES31_9ACTN
MISRACIAAGLTVAALAAAPPPAAAAPPHREARVLGTRTLPSGLQYAGTTVGGLSGIDRDPRTGRYVLVADDRSRLAPARFYTADIEVSASGLGAVEITGTRPFLRPDGTTYPSMDAWTAAPCAGPRARCDPLAPVDPEDIRFDPLSGHVWWSQEGERIVPRSGAPTLIDPSIRRARPDGRFAGRLRLPRNGHIVADDRGPRQNRGIEGFTFAAGGRLVTSVLEAPLLQDGPEPGPDAGALVRLTVQTRGGGVTGQYAYPVGPLSAAAGATGVSAILAAGHGRYLVLEREVGVGAGGSLGTRVRIHEAVLDGATDVARVHSLADAPWVRPVRKRPVAELAGVGVVEGMTWGPRLRTGERTLVLVADDNFGAFGPDLPTKIIALALP